MLEALDFASLETAYVQAPSIYDMLRNQFADINRENKRCDGSQGNAESPHPGPTEGGN